jgi:hypothetical protein
VLLQEIDRYNVLLDRIHRSLADLHKGIKGEAVISPELVYDVYIDFSIIFFYRFYYLCYQAMCWSLKYCFIQILSLTASIALLNYCFFFSPPPQENMFDSLYEQKVPKMWSFAYKSLKPLGNRVV